MYFCHKLQEVKSVVKVLKFRRCDGLCFVRAFRFACGFLHGFGVESAPDAQCCPKALQQNFHGDCRFAEPTWHFGEPGRAAPGAVAACVADLTAVIAAVVDLTVAASAAGLHVDCLIGCVADLPDGCFAVAPAPTQSVCIF